jgi:hypothetical protein
LKIRQDMERQRDTWNEELEALGRDASFHPAAARKVIKNTCRAQLELLIQKSIPRLGGLTTHQKSNARP